jgi:mutator protein MutT
VIISANETGRFLIARRSSLVNNSGQWNFFGGKVDQGETPKAAARRELAEEAGIKLPLPLFLKLGKVTLNSGFRFYYFRVKVEHEFRPKMNNESDLHKWVSSVEKISPAHKSIVSFRKLNRG